MARPLRIEFPGATYHVTARGNDRALIFHDDADRRRLLQLIEQGTRRLNAEVIAYCLMGNHYHLVVLTRQANLSRLMRHINGEYTRRFNKRHERIGHLLQGRFKAILVDKDSYLMELCRYVELNPVRAGLVRSAGDWPWSSYLAHTGQARAPTWLATAVLHAHLLGREALAAKDHEAAARLYAQLVEDGLDFEFWDKHLHRRIYLGNERFVANMQLMADQQRARCPEIPKVERTRSPCVDDWALAGHDHQATARLAYSEGGMTMSAIAKQSGVSVATVSRLIARTEPMRQPSVDDVDFQTPRID